MIYQDNRLQRMARAIKTVIECMGEDIDREGLEKPPIRVAKALQFFMSGYRQTLDSVIGEGIIQEETNSDMVMVRSIDIHSLY